MAGWEFTGVPDRLDEDKPQASESDEVGREAPDEVELGFCDSCGEDKPLEGGKSHVVDQTYVDHMLVSTESDWFCKDCDDEWKEAMANAEIDRHERYLEAQMDYYYEK